jgi:hypothetical protein
LVRVGVGAELVAGDEVLEYFHLSKLF